MRNMLRRDADLWRENAGRENDRPEKEKSGYKRGRRKAKRTGGKRK